MTVLRAERGMRNINQEQVLRTLPSLFYLLHLLLLHVSLKGFILMASCSQLCGK